MTPPPPPALSDSPTDTDDVQTLIELLQQQKTLYGSLQTLSGRQQAIIEQGDTEQLLAVLSERQVLVDQLTKINKQVAPLRGRMSEISAAAPESHRKSLRALVDDVQAMLQAIIDRDEQDRRVLEASKASVGQQLKKIKTAPAAMNAYKANAMRTARVPASVARFTDSRG